MTVSEVPVPRTDQVYLDHHASTPLEPVVLEAMEPWLRRGFGNPSNILHAYGREAAEAREWARSQVAALIGATPRDIVFTSGATEANNLAISGVMQSAGVSGVLLTSSLEHPSVHRPAEVLADSGLTTLFVPGDSTGMIRADRVEELLQSYEVSLVSIIAVQGEVGTINPISDIARLAHRYGALVHTDAAQAVGKIPVNVDEWEVDYLTIAAHKMYGPKGIGALYHRPEAPLRPLLFGAGHEGGLRPGTENVPYIVGFGRACGLAMEDLEAEGYRQRNLRDWLRDRLQQTIPDLHINGHPELRHPGNLHISIRGVHSTELLEMLPGYALSVGSACHSSQPMENPLIQALQIPAEYARGSIRIGIGRSNTREQIEQFAFDLEEAYHKTLSKSA